MNVSANIFPGEFSEVSVFSFSTRKKGKKSDRNRFLSFALLVYFPLLRLQSPGVSLFLIERNSYEVKELYGSKENGRSHDPSDRTQTINSIKMSDCLGCEEYETKMLLCGVRGVLFSLILTWLSSGVKKAARTKEYCGEDHIYLLRIKIFRHLSIGYRFFEERCSCSKFLLLIVKEISSNTNDLTPLGT